MDDPARNRGVYAVPSGGRLFRTVSCQASRNDGQIRRASTSRDRRRGRAYGAAGSAGTCRGRPPSPRANGRDDRRMRASSRSGRAALRRRLRPPRRAHYPDVRQRLARTGGNAVGRRTASDPANPAAVRNSAPGRIRTSDHANSTGGAGSPRAPPTRPTQHQLTPPGRIRACDHTTNTTPADAPGWIRTSDLRIRSPLLYPAELRGRAEPLNPRTDAGRWRT